MKDQWQAVLTDQRTQQIDAILCGASEREVQAKVSLYATLRTSQFTTEIRPPKKPK